MFSVRQCSNIKSTLLKYDKVIIHKIVIHEPPIYYIEASLPVLF